MKIKLPPVFDLLSNLEMFLDHKGYRLDDLIYICIMVEVLAVCETMEVSVIKYQAENPKNQISFLI